MVGSKRTPASMDGLKTDHNKIIRGGHLGTTLRISKSVRSSHRKWFLLMWNMCNNRNAQQSAHPPLVPRSWSRSGFPPASISANRDLAKSSCLLTVCTYLLSAASLEAKVLGILHRSRVCLRAE